MKTNTYRLAAVVLGAITFTTFAGAASASPHWRQDHPRRVEVNARLDNLDRRIHDERREGDLTKAQAHDLRVEDRGIRSQERFDASKDHSHLTRGEYRQLNHEENGLSHQVGK